MATHVEVGRLARGKMLSPRDSPISQSTGVEAQKGKDRGGILTAGRLQTTARTRNSKGKIGGK